MVCPNCGSANNDGAKFCIGCGATLDAPQAQPAQPAYNSQQNVNYNFSNNQQPAATPGKGLGIASLVCGIVSFFCFGFILGLLAVIFGGVAKSKGYRGGMATAGIVLGIIGLAFYVILLIIYGSAILSLGLF